MFQPEHLTMRDLPDDDRPTEKLFRSGAATLSDAELIAVIIRHGSRQETALSLAQRLIATFEPDSSGGMLDFIRTCSVEEMTCLPGIGRVKAVQLKAAAELGMRIGRKSRVIEKIKIQCPDDLFPELEQEMSDLPREKMKAVLLDVRNRVIRMCDIGSGGLSSAVLFPRDIFREAIRANAASIILVHNHPSGDPEPSSDDLETTRKLCELGDVMGIRVIDHLIIARGRSLSLRRRGLMS